MQTGLPFPPLSPDVFTLSLAGMNFTLRWYALAYIVGVLIAWMIMRAAAKRPQLWAGNTSPMTAQQVENYISWSIVGIILGGRLGYTLIYNPQHYIFHPLDILKLWEGGMSFHGGFLGVVLTTIFFARKNKIPLSQLADIVAVASPWGLLLGRLANFTNAELWGRQTDLPWGVIFPGQAAQECGQLAGQMCARHPSQLYEALLEGLLLGAVMLGLAWRKGALKSPWLLTGVFLAGYGIARFLVEFVRQPDAQFASADNPLGLAYHIGGYGLTMGQALSLPMILVGLWLILRKRRHG